MTNQIFKLPPRKWYSLEQACERIEKLTGDTAKKSDLLHFWHIGKLPIYIEIHYKLDHFLSLGGLELSRDSLLSFTYHSDTLKSSVNDAEFDIDLIQLTSAKLTINEEIKKTSTHVKGGFFNNSLKRSDEEIFLEIKGLISLQKDFTKVFTNKERDLQPQHLKGLATPPTKNGEMIYFNLNTSKKDYFTLSPPMFILESDLQKLLTNQTDAEAEKERQISTKTANRQIRFIRDLLILNYGEDVANNISVELDNPLSEIRRDFEIKGLKPISGKTARNWNLAKKTNIE